MQFPSPVSIKWIASFIDATIIGNDIYLGFIHIQSLQEELSQTILTERECNGKFTDLHNFMKRVHIGIEQLKTLIRLDVLRFTKKQKRELLWEAHLLFNKQNSKPSVIFRDRRH